MRPVYRDEKVHVLSEKCSTCIFRPGNLMHLEPGRVKGMVEECLSKEGGNIPCHKTLDGDQAICRGYFDAYADQDAILALAKAMDIITQQDPPHEEGEPDEHRRTAAAATRAEWRRGAQGQHDQEWHGDGRGRLPPAAADHRPRVHGRAGGDELEGTEQAHDHQLRASMGGPNVKHCPHCGFGGTDDEVDAHRAESHRDEPQAGSNESARPR